MTSTMKTHLRGFIEPDLMTGSHARAGVYRELSNIFPEGIPVKGYFPASPPFRQLTLDWSQFGDRYTAVFKLLFNSLPSEVQAEMEQKIKSDSYAFVIQDSDFVAVDTINYEGH